MEASYPDGGNSLWYNSAYFQEPDAPHEVIQGADGLSWYAMTPAASIPEFEPETPAPSGRRLQSFRPVQPGALWTIYAWL